MTAAGYIVAVVGALGVIFGAYFAFRGAKRQTSGTPFTAAAETLWEVETKLREEAVADAAKFRRQVDEVRDELRNVKDENVGLHRRVDDLERQANDDHRVITSLKAEVEQLRRLVNGGAHG